MDSIKRLLCELVSIPSVNPAYRGPSDPAGGEARLARFVLRFARQAGLRCRTQAVAPGRANVLCQLAGPRSPRRLIFLTHLDTVGASGMTVPPFEPTVKRGLLYGRGSCDAKASLAALLIALGRLASKPPRPAAEILLVATAGEEADFIGVRTFIDSGCRADGCIVGEPTSLKLVVAHKGLVRWRVRTHGKTAHSATPQKGVNAIYRMAPILSAIQQYARRLARQRHPLLGAPTINVGRISGGTAVNVVPDACTIEIDLRLLPGMSARAAMRELTAFLNARGARGFSVEAPFLTDLALEQDTEHPLVRLAQRVTRARQGRCPLIAVPYGTDGSKTHRAGIPTVVLGPGDAHLAHAPHEHVALAEVAAAADIYEQIAREF